MTGVSVVRVLLLSLAAVVVVACRPATPVAPPRAPAPVAPPREPHAPSTLPAAPRVVAIGDLHGDLDAARRALRLAGATDDADRWIGGALVVVQVGDQIDRGDDDRAVLDLFERLADDARAAGGRVIPLLGNHEVMNVDGDLRYVTPASLAAFGDPQGLGRRKAFAPGAAYARLLARRNVAVRVGDDLFVHGGLSPAHAAIGLDAMNTGVRAFLEGRGPRPAVLSGDPESMPLWSRRYSDAPDAEECAVLDATLGAFSARRMVVAHTVQAQGIRAVCDGQALLVDVGMSRHYGGPIEVLVLEDGGARVAVERGPMRVPSGASSSARPRRRRRYGSSVTATTGSSRTRGRIVKRSLAKSP